MVREAVEDYQQITRRHTLRLDARPESIVGTFDVRRLDRVMHNLVGNAIKCSPRGGCVSVSVHEANGWATMVVRDQGVGIPDEDLPHLFETVLARRAPKTGAAPSRCASRATPHSGEPDQAGSLTPPAAFLP